MSDLLHVRGKGFDLFVDLEPLGDREPMGEFFCRFCNEMRPAFTAASLRRNKKLGRPAIYLPITAYGQNFCSVCGWIYRRKVQVGAAQRRETYIRDSHTCVYCGRQDISDKTLVVDHVKPVIYGGDNSPDNLVTACEFCNSAKGKGPAPKFIYGRFLKLPGAVVKAKFYVTKSCGGWRCIEKRDGTLIVAEHPSMQWHGDDYDEGRRHANEANRRDGTLWAVEEFE